MNKNLEQVLQHLPKTRIEYKPSENISMHIPYVLTVIDYTRLFLNDFELERLTPEEQLILLHSNNSDPTYTPSTTLAGIFKAREIMKRSKNTEEAIKKCNKVLLDINKAQFEKMACVTDEISKKTMHANLLEYYLNVEEFWQEYSKRQNSKLAPIINFKNKFIEKFTKEPSADSLYPLEDLERAKQVWEEFRKEQHADNSISNADLLCIYRYNSTYEGNKPFEFLYHNPELSAINEQYSTTNIALQILDGSAFTKAENALNRNPYQYIKKVKSLSLED